MKQLSIIYDFDGTITKPKWARYLAIEKCGYKGGGQNKEFLEEVKKRSIKTGEETIKVYYDFTFEILKKHNIVVTFDEFCEGQEGIQYCKGIDSFLSSMIDIAKEKNVLLKNYIISSGTKEYLDVLPIAQYFESIYGTTLNIDKNNNVLGVKDIMSPESKIEIIKNINNNSMDFTDVIYIGDGMTDKPAMQLIHSNGGKAIFVHQPTGWEETYAQINADGIVDYCLEADYSSDGAIFNIIEQMITQRSVKT